MGVQIGHARLTTHLSSNGWNAYLWEFFNVELWENIKISHKSVYRWACKAIPVKKRKNCFFICCTLPCIKIQRWLHQFTNRLCRVLLQAYHVYGIASAEGNSDEFLAASLRQTADLVGLVGTCNGDNLKVCR